MRIEGATEAVNLKRGDLVALIHSECAPTDQTVSYDGTPYRVKSVSFPFVCAEVLGRIVTFDIRTAVFTRVSRDYAKAWESGQRGETAPKKRRSRRKKKKQDDGHERCILCGERMRHRQKLDDREWVWFCPNCDAEAGRVNKK